MKIIGGKLGAESTDKRVSLVDHGVALRFVGRNPLHFGRARQLVVIAGMVGSGRVPKQRVDHHGFRRELRGFGRRARHGPQFVDGL